MKNHFMFGSQHLQLIFICFPVLLKDVRYCRPVKLPIFGREYFPWSQFSAVLQIIFCYYSYYASPQHFVVSFLPYHVWLLCPSSHAQMMCYFRELFCLVFGDGSFRFWFWRYCMTPDVFLFFAFSGFKRCFSIITFSFVVVLERSMHSIYLLCHRAPVFGSLNSYSYSTKQWGQINFVIQYFCFQ